MNEVKKTNVFFTCLVLFLFLASIVLALIPQGLIMFSVSLILGQILMLVAATIYIITLKPKEYGKGRWNMFNIWLLVPITVMVIALMPVGTFLNALSMIVFENRATGMISNVSNYHIILAVFLMAVVPALAEEFVFRGLIYHGYRKVSALKAILMSSFLFGIFHMNFNQFFYAFFFGIVFALLLEATGSIIAPIVAHLLFNAFNTIIAVNYIKNNSESINEITNAQKTTEFDLQYYVILGVYALVGLIIASLLMIFIAKKTNKYNRLKQIFKPLKKDEKAESLEDNESKKSGKIFDVYLAIGITVCLVIMIIAA